MSWWKRNGDENQLIFGWFAIKLRNEVGIGVHCRDEFMRMTSSMRCSVMSSWFVNQIISVFRWSDGFSLSNPCRWLSVLSKSTTTWRNFRTSEVRDKNTNLKSHKNQLKHRFTCPKIFHNGILKAHLLDLVLQRRCDRVDLVTKQMWHFAALEKSCDWTQCTWQMENQRVCDVKHHMLIVQRCRLNRLRKRSKS